MSEKLIVRLVAFGAAIVVFAVASLAGASADNHAQQHSRQRWGGPIQASSVSRLEPIQASSSGPWRYATVTFKGHFGEVQTARAAFPLGAVPEATQVWQQQSTGKVFVSQSIDPSRLDTTIEARQDPYYESGDIENTWLGLGVVLALIILIGAMFVTSKW